jgi:cyclin-dependent kinase 8/11
MSSMGYTSQRRINDNYDVVGFISSGTYGRVYKARNKSGRGTHPVLSRNSGNPIEAFAIKKYAEAHVLQAKADL